MKERKRAVRSPQMQLGLLPLEHFVLEISMACWRRVSARLVSAIWALSRLMFSCNWLLSSRSRSRMSCNLRTIRVSRWRESSS